MQDEDAEIHMFYTRVCESLHVVFFVSVHLLL